MLFSFSNEKNIGGINALFKKYNVFYFVINALPTGTYKLAIIPSGRATAWNFKACTLLCPLQATLWWVAGFHIGRTVPSMNPKLLSNAAPLAEMASAYPCNFGGLNKKWFQCKTRLLCSSKSKSLIFFVIIEISGSSLPNLGIRSEHLHG